MILMFEMVPELVILTALSVLGGDSLQKPRWTLEQCVERGLAEGIGLKRLDLEVKNAEDGKHLSVLDWMPAVSVYSSNDFNWGRSVDMQELVIVKNKASSSASISASASVSSGSFLSAAFSSAERKSLLRETVARRDDGKTELAINITDAYLQLLLSLKMCDNARSDYGNIMIQKSRVAKEVEAGQLSYGSLFEIEAQAASEKESLAEAQGRAEIARLTLSGYLNLSPGEELDVSPPVDDSLPPPSVLPLPEEIPSIVLRHPRMIGAEAAGRGGISRKRAALAALLPDFSVTGAYSTGASSSADGTLGEQFHGNWNPAVSISVSIPVLSGSGNILKYRNASRETVALELEKEKCRRELQSEMEKAISEAKNSYEICRAARENMEAMQRSFSTNEARFEAGMISGSEYLICRGNLQKAVSLYWQARYRYIFQLIVIDYRMGLKHMQL